MEDRIYPQSKPVPAAPGAGGAPSFPPTKAQQYGATRPAYRPTKPPPRRRSSRSCCCSCFCYLLIVIITLILLAAIAAGVFYLLYRPHRPSFTVSSVRLSAFNITTANRLTSRLDLNVTATNPNKKIAYLYDDVAVSVLSNGVAIGDGSIPGFNQDPKNSIVLSTTLKSEGEELDPATATEIKKKSNLGVEISMETKAGVKVGSLKTKKIGIKVWCEGLSLAVPKGKTAAPATKATTCRVKVRVKIWKWYI